MLELVVIFLVTLLISITTIWLYRKLSGWHGFEDKVVGRHKPNPRMKVGLQQGFVSLMTKPTSKAKTVRLPRQSGGHKAPWGW